MSDELGRWYWLDDYTLGVFTAGRWHFIDAPPRYRDDAPLNWTTDNEVVP